MAETIRLIRARRVDRVRENVGGSQSTPTGLIRDVVQGWRDKEGSGLGRKDVPRDGPFGLALAVVVAECYLQRHPGVCQPRPIVREVAEDRDLIAWPETRRAQLAGDFVMQPRWRLVSGDGEWRDDGFN